jgi:hypothetical protein
MLNFISMELIQYIRNRLIEERLMFAFRGEINNSNTISLLSLLEKEMENSDYGLKARKRLFMFVLENLQNISRHGESCSYSGMSLVQYSKTDDGYTITTGNIVKDQVAKNLSSRLEQINKLTTEELKELYKQVLCSSELSSKGGAGLGLFEMANKTGNKLDYDFIPKADDYSYFILSKTVNSEGVGVHSADHESQFSGESAIHLERFMEENNIFMIWSGHINSDVGNEVLSITETRLNNEADLDAVIRRRVFFILMEMLENVALHSPGPTAGKEHGMPLAVIRYVDNSFILTTGNLILNSAIDELKTKLSSINRHYNGGIKDMFVRSLSHQTIETDSTGNLGLISIARKSGNRLDYRFNPINDVYSYYTLGVQVEGKP